MPVNEEAITSVKERVKHQETEDNTWREEIFAYNAFNAEAFKMNQGTEVPPHHSTPITQCVIPQHSGSSYPMNGPGIREHNTAGTR